MPSPRRTSRLFRCTKWTCTILAGAMVVAWIGSRWVGFNWTRYSVPPNMYVVVERGVICVWRSQNPKALVATRERDGFKWYGSRALNPGTSWFWAPRFQHNALGITCEVPLWLPTLVFAVPAAWMWRVDVKRRRAAREGCCAKCGYSLVGTPAERPCPECGTAKG